MAYPAGQFSIAHHTQDRFVKLTFDRGSDGGALCLMALYNCKWQAAQRCSGECSDAVSRGRASHPPAAVAQLAYRVKNRSHGSRFLRPRALIFG